MKEMFYSDSHLVFRRSLLFFQPRLCIQKMLRKQPVGSWKGSQLMTAQKFPTFTNPKTIGKNTEARPKFPVSSFCVSPLISSQR